MIVAVPLDVLRPGQEWMLLHYATRNDDAGIVYTGMVEQVSIMLYFFPGACVCLFTPPRNAQQHYTGLVQARGKDESRCFDARSLDMPCRQDGMILWTASSHGKWVSWKQGSHTCDPKEQGSSAA